MPAACVIQPSVVIPQCQQCLIPMRLHVLAVLTGQQVVIFAATQQCPSADILEGYVFAWCWCCMYLAQPAPAALGPAMLLAVAVPCPVWLCIFFK